MCAVQACGCAGARLTVRTYASRTAGTIGKLESSPNSALIISTLSCAAWEEWEECEECEEWEDCEEWGEWEECVSA